MREILSNSAVQVGSAPRLERRPIDEIKPHPHHARKPSREHAGSSKQVFASSAKMLRSWSIARVLSSPDILASKHDADQRDRSGQAK
jgi:hypothetical protein